MRGPGVPGSLGRAGRYHPDTPWAALPALQLRGRTEAVACGTGDRGGLTLRNPRPLHGLSSLGGRAWPAGPAHCRGASLFCQKSRDRCHSDLNIRGDFSQEGMK